MPKIVPKSIQTCFELVLGQFFRKIFCPVFHGWSSLQKFSKKSKKFQSSKNAQNRSQKYSNVFRTSFGANFSKNFCPVFHGVSSLRNFSKKIKNFSKFQPKTHKTVLKRIQKCFEHFLGHFFRKIFAQFSMECRVFETFQKKIKKYSKITPKTHKTVPKESKSVLNIFWGDFFENFLPSFPWKVESSKNFKKSQEFSKFQKCPKSFPKASRRVWNVFWGEIFDNFFAQCSMDGRVFKNFQKNQRNFKIPKNAQNRSQKYSNVF